MGQTLRCTNQSSTLLPKEMKQPTFIYLGSKLDLEFELSNDNLLSRTDFNLNYLERRQYNKRRALLYGKKKN